jgi:hypothetical protein
MKAYELIKETLFRKSYIPAMHIIWFLIYALLFLPPVSQIFPWGRVLFIISGFILPLVLSVGIFGDDIASGRISVLVTKPIRFAELYIYRVIGLSLQSFLHITLGICIIYILNKITDKGSLINIELWALSSWLLFNTLATLSTTISIVVYRGHNFMFLVLAAVIILGIRTLLIFSQNYDSTILLIIKYIFPPVELLSRVAQENHWSIRLMGYVAHAFGLTIFYAVIGILLLSNREFRRVQD